jgi:phosphoglycerate dehydrogenase-like enzyme
VPAQTRTIVYRLQPWAFVDDLVFQQCPPGFRLEPMARDASLEQRQRLLTDAEFLMGSWVTTTVTLIEDDYRAAPHLKLVQLMSAGYEHVDLDLAARYSVPVAHFGGSNASVVAEHCVMLILALYRHLFQLDAAVRDGSWRKGDPSLYELRGKRVGLIGLGYIGRELAVRLRAFGCEVIYFARHRVEQDMADWLPLDDLLRTSDVVSLHVPIAPSTRGLLGARELGLVKPGALLINTSRGGVVDESALAEALSAGRLAGAGVDVFEHEPPDAGSPLLRVPNVICTPHIAGSSVEVWPRVVDTCFANIQRVARGEAPLHLARKLD